MEINLLAADHFHEREAKLQQKLITSYFNDPLTDLLGQCTRRVLIVLHVLGGITNGIIQSNNSNRVIEDDCFVCDIYAKYTSLSQPRWGR